MNKKSAITSRNFPRLAWAWPEGGRNQLVLAAICPDENRAYEAIKAWLRETDLDDATFAEHRLLAAITTRFDARLTHHPEYARLCGLQRLNWTRSRMAIATSKPVLQEMVDAGLKVILLKGAARVALDISEQKSRTSYDLDLLLKPGDFEQAFEILARHDWASSRGESVLGLRARLSSVRARNFKKGHFGDIDLHRFAYHTSSSDPHWEAELFADLCEVEFYELKAYVPGPEERLAMAISHGGWDGQSHSDWLVDIAHILATEPVDFTKFESIVRGRGLQGAGSIALSYLSREVGLNIPDSTLHRICGQSTYASPTQLPALLLAKEAEAMSRAQKIVRRTIIGYKKLWYSGRNTVLDAPLFRAFTKVKPTAEADGYALSLPIALPDQVAEGAWRFDLTLETPAPVRSRRLEFELNSAKRNLCHLQAIHLKRSGDTLAMRFRGRVTLGPEDRSLVLDALPSKLVEDEIGSYDHQKYATIPFALIDADLTRAS